MNFTLDLGLVLNSLTVLGVAWLLKSVLEIKQSLAKVKVWMEGHDKQDDERHREVGKALDNLWDKINIGRGK